jgi:hypothetical protein
MASTTSMPSTTSPKMVCFPSSQGVAAWVMKNWDPLVLGPALAMARNPGRSKRCGPETSSSNWYPGPPRPFPSGSPPWIMKLGMTRWKTVPS